MTRLLQDVTKKTQRASDELNISKVEFVAKMRFILAQTSEWMYHIAVADETLEVPPSTFKIMKFFYSLKNYVENYPSDVFR